MNEWASKLLSPLQGISDRNKADFDQFIVEVNNDQLEQMYYHKELNVDAECRPTFDQLSLDRIIDETQRTINTLKSLENILAERYGGFTSLNNSLLKARTSFEGFETTEGTLKLAADAFYIFSEQESAQSKQQIFLSDLKTSLTQMRHDAQRKLADYQKEIMSADKEVATAEKKLGKSREAQEKGFDYRNKLESFELDGILHNVRTKGRSGNETKKDLDEMAMRLEKDVRDDVQHLLSVITKRDQVLSASRRAFQKLTRDCKRSMFYTLRKIADKEKDFLETRRVVLEKFEQNISQVDIEADINDFIDNHRMEEGALSMQARALSLLEDLLPQIPTGHGGITSSTPSPSSSTLALGGTLADSAPLPSPPTSEAISGAQSNKRSGSILVGAFSAMSNMMNNSNSSSQSNNQSGLSSANTQHGHSQSPPNLNLPTGTIISSASTSPPTLPTVNSSITATSASFPQWEFAAYLSQVFYDTGESVVSSSSTKAEASSAITNNLSEPNTNEPQDQLTKTVHRRARCQQNLRIQFHDIKTIGEQEFVKIEGNRALSEAIEWLVIAIQTKRGRDTFITELNQFRSRKVELGGGFDALGVVLWKTLSFCQEQNDVHNSKIIMMLSQTFYRLRPKSALGVETIENLRQTEDDEEEDDDAPKRGVEYREYIKEKLMGHPIWEDGNFWEQALWQCAIDQLQTIPYERPWYEMEKDVRNETVRRVHDVLFSQVMAIIHSMMELGCQQRQTREFLYRMCVVHQLSEGQRQQLLAMVLKR